MKKRSVKKPEETTEFESVEAARAAVLEMLRVGEIVTGIAVTFFRGAGDGIRIAIHPDTANDTLRVKRMIRREGYEPVSTLHYLHVLDEEV